MVERNSDGWFIKNVRDADWIRHDAFGMRCRFEPADAPFESIGIGIKVIEPDQPACRYHRENAQEDFLVLSGRCRVLIDGQERELRAWDFVHCPPGVDHVFIGAGDGPCAILMIGHRPEPHRFFYPFHDRAAEFGAQTPEETSDPRVAYSDVADTGRAKKPGETKIDVSMPEPCEAPDWPLS